MGIGGITLADINALLSAGLHGVAVSGAISGAADAMEAARQLVAATSLLPTSA